MAKRNRPSNGAGSSPNRLNVVMQFRKQANKPPVFTFRRSDGSTIWNSLRNLPIEHDLAHYAVEKALDFKQGFYGLLNAGFSPEEFELPRDKRPVALLPANLPAEAHQAEHIVGLLQTEWVCGPIDTFLPDVAQMMAGKNVPFPAQLTDASLNQIRDLFGELVYQWHTLPPGAQLELTLSID